MPNYTLNPDGSITISNYIRDLPPEIARVASFFVVIGPAEDQREEADKTAPACETTSCTIGDRS
jgi:hypothetical protein